MSTSKKSDGVLIIGIFILVIVVICSMYYMKREAYGQGTYIIEGLGGGGRSGGGRSGGSGGTRWLGSGSALSRSRGGLGGGGRGGYHRPWGGWGRRYWDGGYPYFYNYYAFPYYDNLPYYYDDNGDACVTASYNEKAKCDARGGKDCDVKLARMLNECD